MSIKENGQKVKGWLYSQKLKGAGYWLKFEKNEKAIFVVILLILVAVLSFGLGRLSKIEEAREPVCVENYAGITEPGISKDELTGTTKDPVGKSEYPVGSVLASSRGKKYYFPWCSGLNNIKESNRIIFSSESEAQAKGLTLSASCSRYSE